MAASEAVAAAAVVDWICAREVAAAAEPGIGRWSWSAVTSAMPAHFGGHSAGIVAVDPLCDGPVCDGL